MLIQRLHPDDDAIVALRNLRAGETVSLDGRGWKLRADIPAKHKFASRDFAEGELVKMYGTVVGRTRCAVACGELLSQGNVAHAVAPAAVSGTGFHWSPPDVARWRGRTFDGYRRADGRCGTANMWLVVPMVFCENRNVDVMREALTKGLGYDVTTAYANFVSGLAGAWRTGAAARRISGSWCLWYFVKIGMWK